MTGQSTFERRRIAPAHWWARADNARLSAATIWQLRDGGDFTSAIKASIAYGGSPSIAYGEAFQREAAVALELITKAVIAQRMTMRHADPAFESVPTTHDLPTLWGQAGLIKLGREDRYRLLRLKSVLMWSGRYATPRTEQAWERELEAFRPFQPPRDEGGRPRIHYPIPCGWPEFDHLYQLAAQQLFTLWEQWGLG